MQTDRKVTIGVEKYIYEKLIPRIDNTKYLNLNNNETQRSELFNFALALGLKVERTKIKQIVGLWRWEVMGAEDITIYDSIWYSSEYNSSNIHGVLSGINVISIVEEFANTGFHLLEQLMESKDDENLALSLILEMDELYKGFEI